MARLSSLLSLAVGVLLLPSLPLASPASQSRQTGLVVVPASLKPLATKTAHLTDLVVASTGITTEARAIVKYSDTAVGNLMLANSAIAAGVLGCVAVSSGVGLAPCLGVGAFAVFLNYLTFFLFTSTSVVKRAAALPGKPLLQLHGHWQPVDGCDAACAFLAGAPANAWAPFSNLTYADGTVIQVNAMHDGVAGGGRGLQAVVTSSAASATRRQIATDYDTVTTEFYFLQEGLTAQDDFINDYDGSANDLADAVAVTISDWEVDWEAAIMCSKFYDADGYVVDGLWTFDINNAYLSLNAATALDILAEC